MVISRRVFADVLLLDGPSGFDRIQVRRVRWEVDDPDALGTTRRANTWIMVSGEVIHDDRVTALEFG
jgi:hypothetical protein